MSACTHMYVFLNVCQEAEVRWETTRQEERRNLGAAGMKEEEEEEEDKP